MSGLWNASWFDGRQAKAHAVQVSVAEGALLIRQPALEDRRYALRPLMAAGAIGERFQAAPTRIELPDGGSLQLDDSDGGFEQALKALGARRGIAQAITRSWPATLAALVLLVASIVWVDRVGMSWVAEAVVPLLPAGVEQHLSDLSLQAADAQWLQASNLSAERRQRLARRFEAEAARQYPGLKVELLFRTTRGSDASLNAFALPDGRVVLFDALAMRLSDDEALALLGHELGHVVHRHGMKGLVRGAGLLAVGSLVWGDFSSVAATVVGGVQSLRHSREAEREADAHARAFSAKAGLPPQALERVWQVFLDADPDDRAGAMPGFLLSHPPTQERLERAREAAQAASAIP